MRTGIVATIGLGLVLAGCQAATVKAPPGAVTATLVCEGYGLTRGTKTYDECVAYQESRAQLYPGPSVPPYRMDQYNNRVDAEGYRVDAEGRRLPVQNLYEIPPGAASGSRS